MRSKPFGTPWAMLALTSLTLFSCNTPPARNATTSTANTASSASTGSTAAKQNNTSQTGSDKKAVPASTSKAAASMRASSLAYPTGDPATSALLIEKYVPYEAIVGKTVSYQTVVTNLTSLPLENVLLTETVDANFNVVSSDPRSVSSTPGMASWNLGTLQPREQRTITVEGSPKNAEPIDACVSVTYASALCTTIPVVAPAIKVAATGPAEVIACDDIIYKYVVTNTGSGDARNVMLEATLPTGMTDESGRTTISKNVGTLSAGKSQEVSVKVKAGDKGAFQHSARATADGNLSANSEVIKTTVRKPELKIAMAGPAKTFAGRSIKYDISVTNVGDGIARDAVIQSQLPKGLKFDSATDNGKSSATAVQWNIGDLAPQASKQVSVRYTSGKIESVAGVASVKAFCAADASASVQTQVEGISAILLEVIDLEDPVEVGSEVTYLIKVTNQGTAPDTNIKVSVTLPTNTSFVKGTGASAVPAAAAAGGVLTMAPVPVLEGGKVVEWRLTLRGESAADARFKVSLTTDQRTAPIEETEATNYYE